MELGLCVFASRFDRGGGDPRRVWSSARSSRRGRDKASSQVRDDPKWWGFACICKCLFMSCM